MEDNIVIILTLFIDFFIIAFYLYDLYANRRAFNSLKELLFRIIIPLLISVFYLIPYIAFGWNSFALLIFLQFVFNVFMALVLWESEAFLGVSLDLEKVGRIWLYLHYYFSDSQKFEVNLYKWTDENTTLDILVKLIEEFGIFNREKKQFETEEDYQEYMEAKKSYLSWKPLAKNYKLDVYSYYDFTEKWRGFKKLYFINKLGLIGKKIEGNAVILSDKVKIAFRKFQQVIVWEGFRDKQISEELETTKMVLKSITYLSEIEEIPLLKEEIKKKDKIMELQRETIQNIEDDLYLADIRNKNKFQDQAQSFQTKWFKYIFALIVIMLGFFLITILLMSFGVI